MNQRSNTEKLAIPFCPRHCMTFGLTLPVARDVLLALPILMLAACNSQSRARHDSAITHTDPQIYGVLENFSRPLVWNTSSIRPLSRLGRVVRSRKIGGHRARRTPKIFSFADYGRCGQVIPVDVGTENALMWAAITPRCGHDFRFHRNQCPHGVIAAHMEWNGCPQAA